ncbi:MAG: hypothetical protein AAFX50_04025 [Acidobacteriota bacterium]
MSRAPENPPEPAVEELEKLPIHLATKARALVRRWPWVPLILVIAAFCGVAAGLLLGSKVYRAETVLLFTRAADSAGEIGKSTYLASQLHTVKLPENLLRVREGLSLPMSLQSLASATAAHVRKDTGLLVIEGRADRADVAAEIANGLRDVFLASHVRIMAREAADALDRRERGARGALTGVVTQLERLGGLEGEVRSRIADDRRSRPEEEGLGDVNIRVERLRDVIIDDQKQRWNEAELAKRIHELERADRLVRQGLLPSGERDRLASEVAKQQALTVDTEEVKAWKDELDRLLAVALPSESATSPSAPVLQEMLLKDFNLRLDRVRLERELRTIAEERREVDRWLDLTAAGRDVPDVTGSGLCRFQVLSEARPPTWPESSNRRLVALALWLVLAAAGLFALAAVELADTRLKSAAEAEWLLGRRVYFGFGSAGAPADAVHLLSDLLLEEGRVLLTSIEARDPSVARRLGEQIRDALAERDLDVALVDGDRSAGELASPDFERELERAAAAHPLVVVIAPPVAHGGDPRTALLARRIASIVAVVSGSHARRGRIESALGRLEDWAGPVLGLALDQIEPDFLTLNP